MASIEALAIWQNVMTYFEQLERHLLEEILVSRRSARHWEPTRHDNGSAPNAVAPVGRSIGESDRLLVGRR